MTFDAPGPADRADLSVPAGVLWDLDGTLVDTEPLWIDCEYALIAERGGVWDDRHAAVLVGKDLITSARYIRRHSGIDLSPEQIVDTLLDGVVARVRGRVPWRPGALELLDELAALGVPCALVTMSYRRLAQEVLSALPVGRFATVVAGDHVTHGKPHPEPYLCATERLGVRPGDCVAIEDSPTGLASALAAGVPALGVEYLVPLSDSPGRQVVGSLVGITAQDLGELRGSLRDTG